ncbi:MAG: DNA phosphorothioation system sulfurtransferase DndC [Bacteroidales bacterium]|jgi:DNA sulfur modification protein DndC|nr:DNA phosphorothioation system sulfurtransferase DndC [Bacteroidales bacterium]
MNYRIKYIISELEDQYLIEDNLRPWIIGFSGGKDSTALLQLVWLAVKQIPHKQRQREVYVVCNDTLVENPVIQQYVDEVLKKIEQSAVEQELPIKVQKTIPRLEDSFWVNVVGRGYPVPNNTFRWCTERMKIKPTSRFITEQVAESGEAIILVGTRRSESQTRANSIKKHEIRGKRLTKHPLNPNTFTYSPIKELMLEEVWYIINTMTSPWGADNSILFNIYANASADDYECPVVVTDDKHRSCGQSRFGCWTCTVVKEDKSLTAQVNNGQEWLKPLLDLRQSMFNERNVSENRETTRRNGQWAVTEDGHNQGNYTIEYRIKLLKQILKTQREIQKYNPKIELINNSELIAIQVIWRRDLAIASKNYRTITDYETVSEIYNKIYHKELDMKNLDEKIQKEIDLLKSVCNGESKDFALIQELLELQRQKALLNRKRGLKDEMELVIEKYLKKQ